MFLVEIALGAAFLAGGLAGSFAVAGAAKQLRQIERDTSGYF